MLWNHESLQFWRPSPHRWLWRCLVKPTCKVSNHRHRRFVRNSRSFSFLF
jgi:hypothetical protein